MWSVVEVLGLVTLFSLVFCSQLNGELVADASLEGGEKGEKCLFLINVIIFFSLVKMPAHVHERLCSNDTGVRREQKKQ